MTLDDLVQAYRSGKGPTRDERAGIRAVVAALRDEVDRIWTWEDMPCNTVLGVFNEILDSDAVDAVGGPTREDGHEAPVQAKIVPAPAADVCRWRAVQSSMGAFILSGCNKPMDGGEYGVCPSCGKPIEFRGEAK